MNQYEGLVYFSDIPLKKSRNSRSISKGFTMKEYEVHVNFYPCKIYDEYFDFYYYQQITLEKIFKVKEKNGLEFVVFIDELEPIFVQMTNLKLKSINFLKK